MNEPNPRHDATYDFVVLEHEKPPIEYDMLRHYFEKDRDRTIDKLRWLDKMLGRKQTIPKRVR